MENVGMALCRKDPVSVKYNWRDRECLETYASGLCDSVDINKCRNGKPTETFYPPKSNLGAARCRATYQSGYEEDVDISKCKT